MNHVPMQAMVTWLVTQFLIMFRLHYESLFTLAFLNPFNITTSQLNVNTCKVALGLSPSLRPRLELLAEKERPTRNLARHTYLCSGACKALHSVSMTSYF